MHREIHRRGRRSGPIVQITPWKRGRYKPDGDSGFSLVWEDEWHDWSCMCGAYKDREGDMIFVAHEFAEIHNA